MKDQAVLAKPDVLPNLRLQLGLLYVFVNSYDTNLAIYPLNKSAGHYAAHVKEHACTDIAVPVIITRSNFN